MATQPDQAPPDTQRRLGPINFGPGTTVGVGAAGKQVAEDLSELVKAEIALAKAELSEGMKARAAGAGAFGAAGVMGWLALQGLLITLGFVLALWLPAWAAAAIVTALLLLVAFIAVMVGRSKMQTPVGLDITKANVEEDVAWTKSHLKR